MMLTLKMFLIGITASALVMAGGRPSSTKVIYGEDDRVEPYTVTDTKLLEVSKAVAAMIPATLISMKSNPPARATTRWGRGTPTPPTPRTDVTISAPTLSERNICASERFSNQITAANCSGFLVAEDILVTAGHCIENQSDCDSNRWVFGYEVTQDGKLANITANDVYECKEIIGRALNGDDDKMNDFAVLRLKKKVTGRVPMKVNLSGKPVVADEVIVLGHPTGLPQKIAGGAEVKKLGSNFFFANLDTYGGNSGSAVVNARTYEVEGILVRGQRDYVRPQNSSCAVSNVLSNSTEDAEEVSFIGQVFSSIGINSLADL